MKCWETVKARLLASRKKMAHWARQAVRVVLIAVVVALSISLVLLLLPVIRGEWLGYRRFGFVGDRYPAGEDLTIDFHFYALDYPQPVKVRDGRVIVAEHIMRAEAPTVFAYEGERICLDSITVSDPRPAPMYPGPYGFAISAGDLYFLKSSSESFNDACFGRDEGLGQRLPLEQLTRTHGAHVVVPDYYFPFDRFILRMDVWITGTLTFDDNTSSPIRIAPRVIGVFDPSRWDTSAEVSQSLDDAEPTTVVSLEYRRPLIYRVLTPLILSLLVISIVLLPFLKDLGGFLRASIGLVLGLWGAREMLIPNDVTWPTIIEPLVLTMYALLGVSVFVRLLFVPIWNRMGNRGISHEEDGIRG